MNFIILGNQFHTMLPLSTLSEQYDTKGVYNISAVDEEKAEDFLNHLLEHLDTEYNLNFDSSKFILRNTTMNSSSANMFENVLSIVKIAVYCLLVLMVLFSCIFFTKEISVLKINGY